MLLVIAGAGASYDSVPHLPPPRSPATGQSNFGTPTHRVPERYEEFRPPLAAQLFEDRHAFVTAMRAFPECKAIIPLLRGTIPVEQQLAALEQQEKTFPPRRLQLLAIRFYLQSVVWTCQNKWSGYHDGINNYVTFLDAIEHWRNANNERVCIVTFNYDTMLEQAMEQVLGMTFEHFGRYIQHPNYQLIKLHGSIDWGYELEIPQSPRSWQELVQNASVLSVSSHLKKAGMHVVFPDQTIGYPAIAIPVEKKTQFMCPGEHLQTLGNSLTSVKKIIALGWRAQEQHFLDMLHKRLTGVPDDVDVMVVSGTADGASQTLQNLVKGFQPQSSVKRSLQGSGFTGLIKQPSMLDSFLS